MIEELNLIRKIVWSYVRTNPGMEFDDLFSEACIAVLETLPSYNPKKGEKTTFIWYVVHSHLKNMIGQELRRGLNEYPADINEIESQLNDKSLPGPEQYLIAKESWEEITCSFSPEAQAICDMVLNDSDLYLPLDKPKFCRGIIVRTLRKLGWSWGAIWSSFREIRAAVNQQTI